MATRPRSSNTGAVIGDQLHVVAGDNPDLGHSRCHSIYRHARRVRLHEAARPPTKSADSNFVGSDLDTEHNQTFLIAIFFSLFCACAVFGSVTVRTPFLKLASILSASTLSGTPNERWNEP